MYSYMDMPVPTVLRNNIVCLRIWAKKELIDGGSNLSWSRPHRQSFSKVGLMNNVVCRGWYGICMTEMAWYTSTSWSLLSFRRYFQTMHSTKKCRECNEIVRYANVCEFSMITLCKRTNDESICRLTNYTLYQRMSFRAKLTSNTCM